MLLVHLDVAADSASFLFASFLFIFYFICWSFSAGSSSTMTACSAPGSVGSAAAGLLPDPGNCIADACDIKALSLDGILLT